MGTEGQAVARTHRIGQVFDIELQRIVATGTFDDKMLALQKKKEGEIRKVLHLDPVR